MNRIFGLIVLILAVSASVYSVSVSFARQPINCQNTPAPRLRVGMSAAVADGIDRLNLRAFPAVSTGIEVQLYSGNNVIVLSGPACNGHYNWWRVETANGRRGWVAEGTWEQFYVVPANRVDVLVTPLEWSCPAFSTRDCYEP